MVGVLVLLFIVYLSCVFFVLSLPPLVFSCVSVAFLVLPLFMFKTQNKFQKYLPTYL